MSSQETPANGTPGKSQPTAIKTQAFERERATGGHISLRLVQNAMDNHGMVYNTVLPLVHMRRCDRLQ